MASISDRIGNEIMLSIRRAMSLLLALACLHALGCGNQRKTITLTGIVTYQGNPVTVGMIYFHAPDNQMAGGVILEDGHYTATDVPVGEVRVSLQVKDPGLYALPKGSPAAAPKKSESKGVTSLPPKFADPSQSGLSYTITAATSTLDVKID